MPILNLKKARRIKDQIRLTTQRIRTFIYLPKKDNYLAGFAFVSEFKESTVSIFLDKTIRSGSEIQISFDHKGAQSFKGRVLICNRYAMSQKFIGTPSLNFRATVQFVFASEFEREELIKYLKEVRDRFLFLSQLKKPQETKKAA